MHIITRPGMSVKIKRYEKLEDLAKDLYYVFNERSRNKYSKILAMLADIRKEAEKLLLEAETNFEQSSLQAIIQDCDAIEEILKQNMKNKKSKELLEIHIEDILIESKRLRGKTGEIDPGYDPTENFIPDTPEIENPLLEEAREFYEAEYGDY
jgi:hypothetical protein